MEHRSSEWHKSKSDDIFWMVAWSLVGRQINTPHRLYALRMYFGLSGARKRQLTTFVIKLIFCLLFTQRFLNMQRSRALRLFLFLPRRKMMNWFRVNWQDRPNVIRRCFIAPHYNCAIYMIRSVIFKNVFEILIFSTIILSGPRYMFFRNY